METSTQQLHRLCGIADLPKRKTPSSWQKVTLKFVGAECYVLGTKNTDLSLRSSDGGFGLTFRNNLAIPAESLLGTKCQQALLHDVLIVFGMDGMPELSLASLMPGVYPLVLRKGELVRIS
jgi:hypothetical protein